MALDLAEVAKEKGIKYFLISFSDMFGVARSKLVPARAIKDMQKDGAGFAGFAAWLDMTPATPGHVRGARPRQPHSAALEAGSRLACIRPVDGRQGSRSQPAGHAEAPDQGRQENGLHAQDRR